MNTLNFISHRLALTSVLFMVGLLCLHKPMAHAQLSEPEVREIDNPRTPLGEGFNNRIGGSLIITNFGVGVSGTYARAIGPFTEFTISAGITGILDPSSQEFLNRFTGRRVVPNKYKRALGFPITVGIKQRVFPYAIADNFRFYISASGGPAFAFTYPYFEDVDDNGYRTTRLVELPGGRGVSEIFVEDINGFFTGWSEGEGHWGAAGDISIGVDFGDNFKRQTSFEIGYFFYYYPEGLQIMEPFRSTEFNDRGISVGQEPFFDAQKYFGTPQIKFTYSGWW